MINQGDDVTKLCTSLVTDMSYMLQYSYFNQDISSWDVSNVTNMNGMFEVLLHFNQDISSWDVSNVTNMNVCLIGVLLLIKI